ncbi:MAG: hypothetical protein U1A77_05235 [Pirellulales bacterium]
MTDHENLRLSRHADRAGFSRLFAMLAISLLLNALRSGGGENCTAQELPWTKNPGKTAVKRAETLKELFVNVDDSQWSHLIDGEPLSVNEDETLNRVLLRVARIGGYDWHRLCKPLGDGRRFVDDPAARRADGVLLEGRATRIEKLAILPELARRFEFDHYYRVSFTPANSPYPVVICSRRIPQAWEKLEQLDEPAACEAVFLKTGAEIEGQRQLVFATDRMVWRPDKPNDALGVKPDHVLLAKFGFDVNRLEDLRGRDSLPLSSVDTECFYQMLAAVKEADPQVLAQEAAPFDLPPLLQKPGEQHGKLFHVYGRAKRVTKILLNDPEIKDRFGIDHYYQVDVMVPLGDSEVRVPRDKKDKTGPVINVAFPVICCVLELPERLQLMSERTDLNEDMTFDAFNVRLWSYQSQFLDQWEQEQRSAEEAAPSVDDAEKATRRRQPSPLFIARSAAFAPVVEPTDHGLGSVVGSVLIGAIFVIAVLAWVASSGNRKSRRQLRNAEPPRFELGPPAEEAKRTSTQTEAESSDSAPTDSSAEPKRTVRSEEPDSR